MRRRGNLHPGGLERAISALRNVLRRAEQGWLGSTRRDIRSRMLADAAFEAVLICDGQKILGVNRAFTEVFGYRPAEVLGLEISSLVAPASRKTPNPVPGPAAEVPLEPLGRRKDGSVFEAEVRQRRLPCGRRRPVLATVVRDITERRRLERALEHRANHDPLTGLANRDLFGRRLEEALDRAASTENLVAVLFVDLDGFKAVNDSLGHTVGDRVLCETATRLYECLRHDDTVGRLTSTASRWGGDEFAVLIEGLSQGSDAAPIARRLAHRLALPLRWTSGRNLAVAATVGVAVGGSGDTAGGLLRAADSAMYAQKRRQEKRPA